MPNIGVNLADAKVFTNLPEGTYLGELSRLYYAEPGEGKEHGSIRAKYNVIDGDSMGESAMEFLPMSPNALGFAVAFFKAFGLDEDQLGDENLLSYDEDTMDLNGVDLIGARVIFKISPDAKAPGGFRTRLVSVEDDAPATAGAAALVARKAIEPVAEVEAEEVEAEATEAAPVAAPKRAPIVRGTTAATAPRRSLR